MITVRQCFNRNPHAIHVTRSRSIYAADEGREVIYLCGGDSAGDRRIRNSDDLSILVREVEDPLGIAFERVTGRSLDSYPHQKLYEPSEGPDIEIGHDSEADLAASRYFGSR